MNESIQFSVIVAVYNAGEYLELCADSVLRQSCREFELILVDDGSTDGSSQLCDALAERDGRVRVIHKENGGHTSARNAGLEICRGDYVVFLDSDDWLETGALDVCARAIAAHRPSAVAFGWTEEYPGRQIRRRTLFQDGFYDRDSMKETIFPHLIMDEDGGFFPRALWGKAFERRLLAEYHAQTPAMIRTGEDLCCVIRVLLHAGSVYITNESLYHYRILPGSISRRGDELAIRRCLELVHYLDRSVPREEKRLRSQFSRLVVQQMYSASQRLCCSKKSLVYMHREFRALYQDPVCVCALREAGFSGAAAALRWKQRLLRWRLFPVIWAGAHRR